jgi:hypothetical protein
MGIDGAPGRCIASLEEPNQQQHQADEEEHVHEVATGVRSKDSKQPRDQQYERNLDEHLAS